jgi:hypothetical protein
MHHPQWVLCAALVYAGHALCLVPFLLCLLVCVHVLLVKGRDAISKILPAVAPSSCFAFITLHMDTLCFDPLLGRLGLLRLVRHFALPLNPC